MSEEDHPNTTILQKALELFSNEAYQDAMNLLIEAVERYPDDSTFQIILGTTYDKLNLREKAEESFRKALAIDPEDRITLKTLGLFLTDAHKYSDALLFLRKALLHGEIGKSIINALHICFVNLRYGQDDFIDLYRKAFELSNDFSYLISLGEVYYHFRRVHECIETLQDLPTIEKTVESSLYLARAYTYDRQYEKAIALFEDLIERESGFYKQKALEGITGAYCNLARQYQSQNNISRAIEICDIAILTNPNSFKHYETKSRMLNETGRYNEAIECTKEGIDSIERLPSSTQEKAYEGLFIQRYYASSELGRLSQLLDELQLVVKKYPTNPKFLVLTAVSLFSQGKVKDVERFIDALGSHGISPLIALKYLVFHQDGDYEEAAALIKPYLNGENDNFTRYLHIAVKIAYVHGMKKAAISAYQQLKELGCGDKTIDNNLACFLIADNKYDEALQLLKDVINSSQLPIKWIGMADLAYLYCILGEYQSALTLSRDLLRNEIADVSGSFRLPIYIDGAVKPDLQSLLGRRMTVKAAAILCGITAMIGLECYQEASALISELHNENELFYTNLLEGCLEASQNNHEKALSLWKSAQELTTNVTDHELLTGLIEKIAKKIQKKP